MRRFNEGELANTTGTDERCIREWLINQAAGDYVHYDPLSGKYSLLPEQSVALAEENSPFFVGGGFYVARHCSMPSRGLGIISKKAARCFGANTIPIFLLVRRNFFDPAMLRIW